MKRFLLVLVILVGLGAVVFAAVPTARDELRWRWAVSQNQAKDYDAYLAAWPSGRHAEEARARRENFAWQQADSQNTVSSFKRYLDAYPVGRFAAEARTRGENLSWQDARRRNTASSYQQYIAAYPEGRFAAEARTKSGSLLRDEAPFLTVQRQATRQAYESFLAEFPGHTREATAREALQEMTQGRDIVDLLAQKKIQVRTQGSGIESVQVEIHRLVPHELTVHIPVGTFFASRNASAQNMVTTEEESITLSDDRWVSVSVSAACANRPLDIPGEEDRFDIRRSPRQQELQKLLPVLRRANADVETRQAAVWIVTDDADYADLGTLVSSTGFLPFGGTRAINEEEAARAMKICDEAGINITVKSIWADRNEILQGLQDEALKQWLRSRAKK